MVNGGNIFLNKAISPEQPAANARQQNLAASAAFFAKVARPLAAFAEKKQAAANCSPQHAFALGEAARRQQNYPQAGYWFQQAAATSPRLTDADISIPSWLNIHADGTLSIDWTNAEWRFSEVTIPSAETAVSTDGQQ